MSVTAWILLGIVCLAGIGVRFLSRFLLARDQRIATTRKAMLDPALANDPERGRPRPWVIVNPSKHEDLAAFKASVNATAAELGVPHVHWITTTPEDPGTGQAIEAIAEGASLVIASGGGGPGRAGPPGPAGPRGRRGPNPPGTRPVRGPPG
ncbi:MAG: diacylglycerol kinase, partial [Schaalia hyovaginalis]|nr:diacylglycerol kinase [Schaalia hyovaginalis]